MTHQRNVLYEDVFCTSCFRGLVSILGEMCSQLDIYMEINSKFKSVVQLVSNLRTLETSQCNYLRALRWAPWELGS